MKCPKCGRELLNRPDGEPIAEIKRESDGVYIYCPAMGCGGRLKTSP